MKNQQIALSAHSYMTEIQFNRVNRPCRKVLPRVEQEITRMFNYAG